MAGPVVISIVGDSKGLVNDLGKSESRLSRFGGIAKKAALGVGVALAGAAVGAWKLAKGAAEDQQAAALMAKQFKNSANATDQQVSATERWISKQGVAKGVADDELRPALSKLVVATKDVGEAQRLANLAMDVSAGTGKDLNTVSTALAKAHNGNVGALGRLGVATKDASGKTLSFEKLQKNLASTFGGQATTKANTFSGMLGRLKIIGTELGESIGAKLLPPLTTAATWFISKGLPAIQRFGAAAGAFLQPILKNIGQTIAAAVPFFLRLGSSVMALVPTVTRFGTEVGTRLKPVLDQLVNTFRTQVLPTLIRVQPTVTQIVTVIAKTTFTVLGLAAAILGKVLPPVIRFAGFLIGRVVPAALNVILVVARVSSAIIRFGVSLLTGAAKAVAFAAKVIFAIASIPYRVGNVVGTLLQKGRDLIAGVVRGIVERAGTMASTIGEKIRGLGGKITGAAGELVGTGKDLIRGLMGGVGEMAGELASKVIDTIKGAVKKAKDFFKINSPSRRMADEMGRPLMQGVGVGAEREARTTQRIMQRISEDLLTTATTSVGTSGGTTYSRTQVATVDAAGRAPLTLNVTINVPIGATGADIGRELVELIEDYYASGGRKLP